MRLVVAIDKVIVHYILIEVDIFQFERCTILLTIFASMSNWYTVSGRTVADDDVVDCNRHDDDDDIARMMTIDDRIFEEICHILDCYDEQVTSFITVLTTTASLYDCDYDDSSNKHIN